MAETASASQSRVHRLGRTVIAVALGAWCCWQITAAGFAGLAVRSTDPRLLAVTGTPSHPEAGSILAQALLTADDAASAARVAQSIVQVDPTNDRALRVLGLATEKLGDRDAGARIMREAANLGWRDTPTQLWILRDAAVHDDAVTVIRRADALARRGRSTDYTRAIFLASLNEPRLRAALANSLAKHPVWRTSFFSDVHQRLPASAATGMESLFREMRAQRQGIAPNEWLNYIDRLVDLGDFRRARTLWAINFSIPAARLSETPYDGTFVLASKRPSDAAISQFEWVLNPDTAGAVVFNPGPRGASLTIPAELVGGTTIVSQLMILPPRSYTLTARVEGDPASAAAGWNITCLPSGRELSRRLTRGAEDELSTVAFDVPKDSCAAQRLTLITRDRSDAQIVSIGDVRIR